MKQYIFLFFITFSLHSMELKTTQLEQGILQDAFNDCEAYVNDMINLVKNNNENCGGTIFPLLLRLKIAQEINTALTLQPLNKKTLNDRIRFTRKYSYKSIKTLHLPKDKRQELQRLMGQLDLAYINTKD